MSYFVSRPGVSARRRRVTGTPRFVESLEERTLLSAAGDAASMSIGSGSSRLQVPTETLLVSSDNTAESAQSIRFTATVENANRHVKINEGSVRFVIDSPIHKVVAVKTLDKAGEAGITTAGLKLPATYQVDAIYVPPSSQFAPSTAAPAAVAVSPLSATSFRVVPVSRIGYLNQAVSFTVTALENGKPDPGYTGTIRFSSPTDSWTTFPKELYESLNISAPTPQTTGLAEFPEQTYTFTAADHGTHTFTDAAVFEKAGAEVLRVHQANDGEVNGETTFAVG